VNFQVTGSLLNQVPTPASLPLVGVGLLPWGPPAPSALISLRCFS
jgi:hypothetical protein